MLKIFDGFKQFIMRGNAIDLAVGVVIGAAFNNIVNALVKDLLTPFIGAIARVPDFSSMSFTVNGSKFVVLPMNALANRMPKKVVAPITKPCPECLSEIPLHAKRCGHCGEKIM